jgi:hypothetical protein|tara:strand:- start:289 stop:621 length:333 start_codon:yes stop_codon:yes gene_type:complete
MALTNVKYSNAEKTSISATENGVLLSIPVSAGNTEYDAIVAEELTIADYVAPDKTMDSIREKRNQLLKNTDWQAGTDVTMSDAQTAYRKKLRDLPATNSDPTKIVFPDAP